MYMLAVLITGSKSATNIQLYILSTDSRERIGNTSR